MVLQSVAEMVLSRLLDKIFYGITKQNIQVALLEGKFVLSNIGLQPSLLTELNLPIQLKYSYVERLEIHLPWREEEVSLTINISNIYLLAATADYSQDLYEVFLRKKERIVEAALKEFKSNLERKENKKQAGFMEKLLLNLLDNINIKIECIHLRCENRDRSYSFGVKINEVSARTVGADDQPCFFNRDKTAEEYIRYVVEMDFMGIYFNSKEDYFLAGRSLAEITDQFHRLSHKGFRNYSENMESEQSGESFNYILTISLKTIVKKYIFALERLNDKEGEEKAQRQGPRQKEGKYLFECAINLTRVESRLSDQQYYDLLDLVSLISDYQKTYLQFVQHWHLLPLRQRRAKDISDLLRKKKLVVVGKREKQTLKRNCRKYMGWVFKQTYQEVLKRTFIRQAVKKEVTLKHLKANPKTLAIITKIDNEKLKLWVLISLYYRRMFEEKVSIFLRGSRDKQNHFAQRHITSVPLFSPYEFEQEIERQREASNNKYQIFLKLVANIQEFNFQISRENNLGVFFSIQKLRAQLILREKNYSVRLQMEDLQANVFHCRKHERLKTYVPIIRRNCVLDRTASLLELTYQRNPVGKPFVFTEIDARFQSIQITIYPEAFKQFYQILLGEGGEKRKKRGGRRKEGKEVVEESRSTVRQIGFQKTIIRAKVRTPWIVLPLTAVNDPSQQCWVARLGDFYVDTPQYDSLQARSEEQIFYEQYKMQLKRFQLSYFSSINLFHNWLRFNCSLDNLLKIKAFANQQVITMIEPFSCFVEFALLKSSLSPAIRDRKPKITAKIMIDEVSIKVSKFLMGRLKHRIDNVLDEGAERLDEFIQSNVANIKEENQLSGYCKISYEGIKRMNFYCVLKGSYMYFFINEHYPKYHFFVNLAQTALRLISNEVENFNPHLPKLLCFYLADKQKHHHWRKKILHILNKRARRMDSTTATSTSFRHTPESPKKDLRQTQNKQEQGEAHSNLKLSLAFLMNKLSIQLFDEQEALFLDCNFKKATLEYSTVGERSLKFSLNEWTVCEGDGELFISSNSFFAEQEREEEGSSLNNFLQVCCGFNSITEQLVQIEVKVDKLFLAWKVELFTRILLFFFYDEEAADAPAPLNLNKRQLQIKISFQRFSFYCYFAAELLALTKLQLISIRYFQNDIEEIYDVACKVFEMDKYVDGKLQQRVPMIRRRYLQPDGSDSDQLLYNNFNLSYLLRKKDTDDFPNIRRLKKQFGQEVMVSQIFCDWKDTEIYFENELTFRLLNYILGKVLGTVASKFKKREYSSNYIFESLKLTKLSVFDIVLNNCIFRMPPHVRGFREFSVDIQRLRVTKNIDENFMPTQISVKTIRDQLRFFWESMAIKITRAQANYHVGRQPPIPIAATPFNISLIYSKMNFQREYFVILKHHDGIDRKATIDVIIEEPVIVEAHKIMFVTFLQLFYQNIKHKDGKGQIFEPPLPFPSLRQYAVYIQKVGLNMYHFQEKTNTMQPFSRSLIDRFKLHYKQVGQDSTIRLQGQTISSAGELPVYSLDAKRKKFLLQMQSREGEMKMVINIEHYALQADLDKVNNMVEFLNYDNDYVSNKFMPKKKSSWQYVNLFAKHCQLRLGALRVEGQFYISYLKGMRNDPQYAAKEYLLSQENFDVVRKDLSKFDWEDVVDKEIKVNGEDLRLNINGDSIGGASSFCFNRTDFTCKSTNKRFKRQRIQVGEGALHIQMVDLLTIWEVYNSYIRKKSNFVLKTFYQPWDQLPAKLKVVEKRATEVEIQCISISILPTREADIVRYLRIQLEFPSIIYRTYLDEQEVLVNIAFRLWHNQKKMKETSVGECKSLRIRYLNFKQRKQKLIDIVHGKGIIINLTDFNNKAIYNMLQQAKSLKETTRNNLHIDLLGSPIKYRLLLQNETNKRVKMNINNIWVLSTPPLQEEAILVNLDDYLQIFKNPHSFMEIHEQGNQIIRKSASEINVYTSTLITSSHCLLIQPASTQCKLIYRSTYTLRNFTSCTLYLKDRRVLKKGQSLSIFPIKSLFEFEMSHAGWSKEYRISTNKESQIFGDECFAACLKKEEEDFFINLVDRYVIKNMMPCHILIGDKQVAPLQEYSLGYIAKSQRTAFPIIVGEDHLVLDLTDASKRIKAFTIIQRKDKNKSGESKLLYEIRTQLQNIDKIEIICIYTDFGLRNLTNQIIQFEQQNSIYQIKAKQTLMLPSQFGTARFVENERPMDIVFNKNKQFYSQIHKYTLVNRLDKKATIIKIQSKHIVRNNTNETIDIEVDKNKLQSISPSQTYQLTPSMVRQKSFNLIFGKFFKKSFSLDKKGTNFLQIEQQFYKLTLLQKEESLLIIQDSNTSHKIINKLDSISIIAHTYEHNKGGKPYSIYEINDDTSIQKLVKPQTQAEIGLFSWENPKIELQFYLGAKNIEFKQKFIIDFDKLDHKFSHKIVLHDEKDKKNVFLLVVTIEKDKESRSTITIYREKDFESLPVQKMKVNIQQISISFAISHQLSDNVTFEIFKATFARQKGIQLTDFDIQVEKLLIREGKNVSILGALGNSRFLNSHLILSKTAWGIGISSLMVKLTPFQIICREKIIFKILEKIVQIRAQDLKKSNRQLMDIMHLDSLKSKGSKFMEEPSQVRPDIQTKLEKHWEEIKKQQMKESKILIISNMELSETGLFITYSKEEYKQFDQKIASDQIIKYMLLMPSISQLKISVPHLKITDFTGQPKQFAKELVTRLKQSIGSTIANSFSALPFFDNPIIVVDGIFKYIDGMLSIQ